MSALQRGLALVGDLADHLAAGRLIDGGPEVQGQAVVDAFQRFRVVALDRQTAQQDDAAAMLQLFGRSLHLLGEVAEREGLSGQALPRQAGPGDRRQGGIESGDRGLVEAPDPVPVALQLRAGPSGAPAQGRRGQAMVIDRLLKDQTAFG